MPLRRSAAFAPRRRGASSAAATAGSFASALRAFLGLYCYIGVDVAKYELVAAVFDQAGVTTCANAPAAVNAWLATLPEVSTSGVESTDDYHRLLAERAHARGITV